MRSARLLLLPIIFCVSGFAQSLPAFNHVFIVMEENGNYSNIIGKPTMPYLNSLADTYGLATQYYANTHPSIGNYFMLTTGQIITNNDGYAKTVTVDNVVRHLLAAGKTWKAYEEDLPHAGYVTPNVANYARRHCPLSFFSDVIDSKVQILNLVPFTQFATDLANNTLPDYSFITPNLCNDAHNCPFKTADAWLKANIDPLVKSSTFHDGGLLIITFDESGNDDTHGGGRVAWVAVSPKFSKEGYKSTKLYQHQSTLRLMMEGLGLTTFPGKAASASDMAEFFK
jgi:phosphatidylinositol-3-phosphatase